MSSGTVARALTLGAATTVGFLLVFASVGGAISLGARWLIGAMPWLGVVVGVLLVALGIATLAGIDLRLRPPFGLRAPTQRGYGGALLFGVGYGTCSLACTLPIFLLVVGSALTGSAAGSVLAFVFYALGMGSILTALAVAVVLARSGLAATIRRVVPRLTRLSGALLALVGVYVVYYWAFALVGAKTGTAWSRPLDLVSEASSWVQTWLIGPTGRSVEAWIVAAAAAIATWTLWWRLSARLVGRRPQPFAGQPDADAPPSTRSIAKLRWSRARPRRRLARRSQEAGNPLRRRPRPAR